MERYGFPPEPEQARPWVCDDCGFIVEHEQSISGLYKTVMHRCGGVRQPAICGKCLYPVEHLSSHIKFCDPTDTYMTVLELERLWGASL